MLTNPEPQEPTAEVPAEDAAAWALAIELCRANHGHWERAKEWDFGDWEDVSPGNKESYLVMAKRAIQWCAEHADAR